MILSKNQELIFKFLTDCWQEMFGSLEYTNTNFNKKSGVFKHQFLSYLETDCHQQKLPEGAEISQEFDALVGLRQRAMFLFEFVLLPIFTEDNLMFITNVDSLHQIMNNINAPLIDQVVGNKMLESIIYVEKKEDLKSAVGFLSEFLAIIKNLPMESKLDLSKSLRKSNIGLVSLTFLTGVFSTDFEDHHDKKDLILVHMELLYYTFRRELDYTMETFSKAKSADLIEQILRFPDLSTFAYKC